MKNLTDRAHVVFRFGSMERASEPHDDDHVDGGGRCQHVQNKQHGGGDTE